MRLISVAEVVWYGLALVFMAVPIAMGTRDVWVGWLWGLNVAWVVLNGAHATKARKERGR